MRKSRRGGFRAWAGRPGREFKVEDCLRLNVSLLQRQGVLSGNWTGKWVWRDRTSCEIIATVNLHSTEVSMNLSFTSALGEFVRQSINLKKVPNTFGGERHFLACPKCSTRRRFLYLRRGLFLCRKCHDLPYRCQSEAPIDRLWRAQLRLESLLLDGYTRPKGMHKATYAKLRSQITQFEIRRDLLMFSAIEAESKDNSAMNIDAATDLSD